MRRVLVGTAAAVLVLSGGVASAADDPATGGDDGWEPVPEEYYASVEIEACGSVVTIDSGDVREVEQRSEVLDDGTVFTEYRGEQTVDLTRASDGAMIDELDVSGPGWDLVSADGTEVLVELDGLSIIWAGNDVERAAADEAGLPEDPEFRAAIMGYAEWGTRLAMQNSAEGADVVEHAPVPRWGWGVAPPYRPERQL